ncbi:hypothetical protein VB005_00138 [Metarhizium brunneum]
MSQSKLDAVPEGVVVPQGIPRAGIMMNRNNKSTAIAVDGVTTKYKVEEFDRDANTVLGVADLLYQVPPDHPLCGQGDFRGGVDEDDTGDGVFDKTMAESTAKPKVRRLKNLSKERQ